MHPLSDAATPAKDDEIVHSIIGCLWPNSMYVTSTLAPKLSKHHRAVESCRDIHDAIHFRVDERRRRLLVHADEFPDEYTVAVRAHVRRRYGDRFQFEGTIILGSGVEVEAV